MTGKVLFSAHDPGGANAILPVVAALIGRGGTVTGALAGSARDIFARKSIDYMDFERVNDQELKTWVAQQSPDLYLAGTSGGMTLDKKIFPLLKDRVPSVYVLDYWNNYWQRFSEKEKDFAYMPTLICVPDETARDEMVQEGFDPSRIAATGNPYFETFADTVFRTNEKHETILFISQPLSAYTTSVNFTQYGFDEFDALRGLVASLRALPVAYSLRIRLHPREDAHKFDAYLSNRIHLSDDTTLEEALSEAGLVVSMFSPVLLQAAVAGKSVISYEPGLTAKDSLPSNRSGGTVLVTTQETLTDAFRAYAKGVTFGDPAALRVLFKKNCVAAILRHIDRLVA